MYSIFITDSKMAQGEFRIETDPLRPETIKIAEEELRETPERVKEATAKLRELLNNQKELYYGDDDEFLLTFLRPCKFYPESAIEFVSEIFILKLVYITFDKLDYCNC